ncbi:MAG: hypothetical protein CMI54_04015 [Parcubacteria group bacterium]|nr:hypothetical protein [Parcubacteria group bacterium]|tara:strand:+ start:1874 stop:2362 length:489 start_codon:yes stop_codon:yes gene_type:complete
MASRVDYAVSMTPVRTIAASGDYDAQDVMANDVGKALGGSASINTGSEDHTTVGYASKTVSYANAPATGGAKVALGGDGVDHVMVFIKHTGFEYDSGLGTTANSQGLVVYIETSADLATYAKFTIPAGGAVCIPSITLAADCGLWAESAGAATIAVEYALVL